MSTKRQKCNELKFPFSYEANELNWTVSAVQFTVQLRCTNFTKPTSWQFSWFHFSGFQEVYQASSEVSSVRFCRYVPLACKLQVRT